MKFHGRYTKYEGVSGMVSGVRGYFPGFWTLTRAILMARKGFRWQFQRRYRRFHG